MMLIKITTTYINIREKSSHDAQMNEKEYNKIYDDKLDVTFRVKFMLN